MKIILKPSDLVKLCLYDNFTTYVIGNTDRANNLLEEDLDFELSHNDALVIGLLKVIETDHLIHKFNDYMVNILMTKSFNYEGKAHIKKSIIDKVIENFLAKFPKNWKPEINYKNRYDDLVIYLDKVKNIFDSLEYKTIIIKNKKVEVYSSPEINKSLEFVHY